MRRAERLAAHLRAADRREGEGDGGGAAAGAAGGGDGAELRSIPDPVPQIAKLGEYVGAGSWGRWEGPEEWTLGAFDGGRLVASHCYFPFTMRLDGGAIKVAGVTVVGTYPEYRRRGLVRRMVARSFADYRARGLSVAALWPSQAAIYQRYGYTFGSVLREYRVDTVDIAFADGDGGALTVARVPDVGAARAELKAVHAAFIAQRTGYFHRAKVTWDLNVLDAPKGSSTPVYVAFARDPAGTPRGYVVYTMDSRFNHPNRPQRILIRELNWLDMDAYRSLWSFLARHDLVGEVRWDRAPHDDPAPEIWLEPRMLRHRDHMGFMFRLVDVVSALRQRRYRAAGVLTIAIDGGDRLAPWNEGCWRLAAGPGGGEVTSVPTADGAENPLRLSIKALSSLYIGHRSARELAGWGLLSAPPAAVAAADAIFATAHAPHCAENF